MSLKPNRPAPPSPSANVQSGYKTFDPYFNNDSNNKTQQSSLTRPTVIRPSANQQGKKKPPPRPAPPRQSLIRKNAIKRTKSIALQKSQTPDLLADLQDIFGPPKPTSHPSPVSNRPPAKVALKKYRAPQPQWPRKPGEGSLIDFDAPATIRQSNSTPSFRAATSRTLLDEDLPDVFSSASSTNSSSLQDLLLIKDQFENVSRGDGKVKFQQDPFDNFSHHERRVTSARNDFNSFFQPGVKSATSSSFRWVDSARQDPFLKPFASGNSVTNTREDPFDSEFFRDTPKDSASKNYMLDSGFSSKANWECTSESTTTTEQRSFTSPPEPQHPPPPAPPPEACLDSEKWCRALYDFEAQTPDELSFVAGDVIFVEEAVSCDWWRGHLNSRSGLFPANYVEVETACGSTTAANIQTQQTTSDHHVSESTSCCYAVALYTFVAEQDGDLSFQEGDIIQVLYRINQDWLYGKFKNEEGQFPSNFVKKLSSDENENKMEVIANYDFRGQKEDELTFVEGDVIILVEKVNSDWSKGYLRKDKNCTVGFFPAAFTSSVNS